MRKEIKGKYFGIFFPKKEDELLKVSYFYSTKRRNKKIINS